jgi:ATP-binding cassette subfamily F protein uup
MVQPVSSLSGGEQSRLLIAKLMLQPANMLILDEPTNDLDLPTLTVLEEALSSFDGAVILVTHDRYFLDQATDEVLAFHTSPAEAGKVTRLFGLSQWEDWMAAQQRARKAKPRAVEEPPKDAKRGPKKKLGFKEQREWDTLEARILEAEERLVALETECESPEVHKDGARLATLTQEMASTRGDIAAMYERWAELEALQAE